MTPQGPVPWQAAPGAGGPLPGPRLVHPPGPRPCRPGALAHEGRGSRQGGGEGGAGDCDRDRPRRLRRRVSGPGATSRSSESRAAHPSHERLIRVTSRLSESRAACPSHEPVVRVPLVRVASRNWRSAALPRPSRRVSDPGQPAPVSGERVTVPARLGLPKRVTLSPFMWTEARPSPRPRRHHVTGAGGGGCGGRWLRLKAERVRARGTASAAAGWIRVRPACGGRRPAQPGRD